jgi:hypothetical protein
MKDRRQFDRQRSAIEFICYIGGERFDSVSVDISAAGVFLRSSSEVPFTPGAIVMIVPRDAAVAAFPITLIGRIVRAEDEGETRGYGVKWLRCLTRMGIRAIYEFIASYPEFSQLTLPFPDSNTMNSSVVGYDFAANRFYVPSLPSLTAPTLDNISSPAAQKRGTASPDLPQDTLTLQRSQQGARHRMEPPRPSPRPSGQTPGGREKTTLGTGVNPPAKPGAITQALRVQHEQVPVSIPVQLETSDHVFPCTVRMLSLNTLFLTTEADPTRFGVRARIPLPIPLHQEPTIVYVHCRVESLAPHPQVADGEGAHLTVISVDQEKRPGLFERFVKYLYYRMLTEA